MSLINEALIGIDYKHTANAYVLRDKLMNLDISTQITACLNKLGYMNINILEETKIFLINLATTNLKISLMNDWDSSLKHMTIENYMDTLKETNEYKNFINSINYRIKRAFELSTFVSSANNEGFYNSLTLDELCVIGY
jgi:hypothetical protein